ncbi:MAG TPA: hypothetical protein VEU55_10875 [Gemmatimonadales bacterium]|nr:hypothetical protein [Gemmatimonadales bacterium]
MSHPGRRALVLLGAAAAAACGGGDGAHSPTCGMAQLIGPSLIQEQLKRLPYLLVDVPRGLPGFLPARVAGTAQQSTVSVAYRGRRLAMAYAGPNFPPYPTDSTVYALLVVDDSTQRAQGVLLYEGQRPPRSYPDLGTVSGQDKTIPLYGVRVDWASVNNPRCPLLGAPSAATP